jgi:hypothetical protein
MDLSAMDLLRLWEQGMNQTAPQRALALLIATDPQTDAETLARLNLGERDTRLLALRQQLFGGEIEGTVRCPKCNELMEWKGDVKELRVPLPASSPVGDEHIISTGGYQVTFRQPNSLDLMAADREDNAVAIRDRLLERCLITVEDRQGEVASAKLPASLTAAIVAEMEAADPQADISFAVSCADCGYSWEACFDISSYLWSEINEWVGRTLQTVHRLARAYGWREQDILAMSPLRRRLYLDMVS